MTLAALMVAALLPAWPASAADLPTAVATTLRKLYADRGGVRYGAAAADLNGDRKPEIIVHVLGSAACGSGGCDTLVFTPTATGYTQIARLGITNPPIRASTRSSRG